MRDRPRIGQPADETKLRVPEPWLGKVGRGGSAHLKRSGSPGALPGPRTAAPPPPAHCSTVGIFLFLSFLPPGFRDCAQTEAGIGRVKTALVASPALQISSANWVVGPEPQRVR